MNRVEETLGILKAAAAKTPDILVAYSGGKDSRIVLDLCLRTFTRVEAFHMYFLPGLEVVENELAWARQQFGVTIRQYPHWTTHKCITNGIFCPNHYRYDGMPDWTVHDIYALAMADVNIPLVATGAKRNDSLWRRRMLKTWGDRADVIYPIIGWSLFDVQAYLRARNIPLPDSAKGTVSGIDLSTSTLLWLHDKYPNDFKKICAVFPYAEAVVHRRTWYGVTGETKKKNKGAASAATEGS